MSAYQTGRQPGDPLFDGAEEFAAAMIESDVQVVEIRKAAVAIYMVVEKVVADDVARILNEAAARIAAQTNDLARFTVGGLLDVHAICDQRDALRDECTKLGKDAARYRFVLPMIGGEDSPEADRRTLLLGAALMRGLTGDDAVDAARAALAAETK